MDFIQKLTSAERDKFVSAIMLSLAMQKAVEAAIPEYLGNAGEIKNLLSQIVQKLDSPNSLRYLSQISREERGELINHLKQLQQIFVPSSEAGEEFLNLVGALKNYFIALEKLEQKKQSNPHRPHAC